MTYLDRPWLKSYKLGPYSLDASLEPYLVAPLYHMLDEAAKSYPSQTAILYEGRTTNYQTLKEQVDCLASALAGLGVRKGDKVCLFLPNCPEFVLGYWAVLKVGGTVVPTSILRSEEGLLHEVASSGSRLILCREESLERVLAIREKGGVESIVVTSTDGYDVAPVSGPLPVGVFEMRGLLHEKNGPPPEVKIDPREDLCELAFTGGATGIPKGVMLTHFNRMVSCYQGLPWIMKPMLRAIAGKASALQVIPLFHAYGNFIHLSAVSLGMRLIILPDARDTDKTVECIRTHRPFIIPGVPTQFMRMADAGLRRIPSMLLSGAAPLPWETAKSIREKTGMPISEGYGLTETSTIVTFNLTGFSKILGFVAKEKHGIGVPCPDTDCRLVDPATRLDVPQGEPGELLVRGPQVMKGYWPDSGSGLTSDGWLATGDIAVMDQEGYFQIVDRIKDMVVVSGMKVYTTQVDEVLFRHPSVLMAAAFGVPDPETPGSERVMAIIQLKNSAQGAVTAEDIKSFCREHLPPYAVPSYVEFRDELPLTVTEKVFKKALREEVLEKLRRQGSR